MAKEAAQRAYERDDEVLQLFQLKQFYERVVDNVVYELHAVDAHLLLVLDDVLVQRLLEQLQNQQHDSEQQLVDPHSPFLGSEQLWLGLHVLQQHLQQQVVDCLDCLRGGLDLSGNFRTLD